MSLHIVVKRLCSFTSKERRIVNRKLATDFVNEVNSKTFCTHCGAQPVEWHHEDHPNNTNKRVSSLRTQGVSIRLIKIEMAKCTPLCRSCHMKEDGRIEALIKSHRPVTQCISCGKFVKILRDRCDGCCSSAFVF